MWRLAFYKQDTMMFTEKRHVRVHFLSNIVLIGCLSTALDCGDPKADRINRKGNLYLFPAVTGKVSK